MNNCAYIVKVECLKPHPNADKLQIATIFGEDVIVGLDVQLNDLGIYFPSDLQLSEDFCDYNHLCRKKADGTADIGYLERDHRRVTAIKLRGVKSYGLYCPLSALDYTGVKEKDLTVGLAFTEINGFAICNKYIPKRKTHQTNSPNKKTKIPRAPIAPLFMEHAETDQLAYCLDAFKLGDQIEITLKMHGTSQRTGYLPKLKGYHTKSPLWRNILKKNPDTLGEFELKLYKKALAHATPIYDWGYITGTRRTVVNDANPGFYGSHAFRDRCSAEFEGKLWKGETVYYEVVGYTHSGAPIMPSASNKVVNDKEFTNFYGETTEFSYGCSPNGKKIVYGVDENGAFSIEPDVPQTDFYVYRMTMTNEDGDVVEYTPDFMRYRCEQMGVKTVPVFEKFYIKEPDDWTKEEFNPGEFVKMIAEEYYDGPDPIGKTHVREGVVVRIINRPKFTAYKHKNWSFKALAGIAINKAESSGFTDNADADLLSEM